MFPMPAMNMSIDNGQSSYPPSTDSMRSMFPQYTSNFNPFAGVTPTYEDNGDGGMEEQSNLSARGNFKCKLNAPGWEKHFRDGDLLFHNQGGDGYDAVVVNLQGLNWMFEKSSQMQKQGADPTKRKNENNYRDMENLFPPKFAEFMMKWRFIGTYLTSMGGNKDVLAPRNGGGRSYIDLTVNMQGQGFIHDWFDEQAKEGAKVFLVYSYVNRFPAFIDPMGAVEGRSEDSQIKIPQARLVKQTCLFCFCKQKNPHFFTTCCF